MPTPAPPPLPPPTVPTQPQPMKPPPPSMQLPSSHCLLDQPSAPLPSFLSSVAVLSPENDRTLLPSSDPASISTSEDDPPSASGLPDHDNHKDKPLPARTCQIHLRFFTGHTIAEAGRSAWFDTRLLLIFRLVATAFLIGHLVFFSLHKDISFRFYATWSFTGLTVAFLSVLMCSLIEVLRMDDEDEDEEEQTPTTPRDEEEGAERAVHSEPFAETHDAGLTYVLAQICVPMYQLFVTAMLFSAVVYWAAIQQSDPFRISYSLIVVHIAAPALALMDMLLSMSMRFRFVYVPLFVMYNAAYTAALYAFYKLNDEYVYLFLDPSLMPRSEFIAKVSGLAAATVVGALCLCAVSIARDLRFVRSPKTRIGKVRLSIADDSDRGEQMSPSSEGTSGSSQASPGVDRKRPVEDRVEHMDADYGSVTMVEEVDLARSISQEKGDRLSVPIMNRVTSVNGKGGNLRWQRLSVAGRLSASQSGSSMGDLDVSSRGSAWDLEMDSLQARPDDEYFTMPGAYTSHGTEEVVKLVPIARSESGSVHRLSGSGSARRFSRTSSGAGEDGQPPSIGRVIRSVSGIRRSGSRRGVEERGVPSSEML